MVMFNLDGRQVGVALAMSGFSVERSNLVVHKYRTADGLRYAVCIPYDGALFKWPVVRVDDDGLVVAAGWTVGDVRNAPCYLNKSGARDALSKMAATVAIVVTLESILEA